MDNNLIISFSIIGIGTVLVISILLVACIYESIKSSVSRRIWKYEYTHRFDKQPKAKCYCHDCIYYDNKTHECFGFHESSGRRVADNWFCCRATPKKRKEV